MMWPTPDAPFDEEGTAGGHSRAWARLRMSLTCIISCRQVPWPSAVLALALATLLSPLRRLTCIRSRHRSRLRALRPLNLAARRNIQSSLSPLGVIWECKADSGWQPMSKDIHGESISAKLEASYRDRSPVEYRTKFQIRGLMSKVTNSHIATYAIDWDTYEQINTKTNTRRLLRRCDSNGHVLGGGGAASEDGFDTHASSASSSGVKSPRKSITFTGQITAASMSSSKQKHKRFDEDEQPTLATNATNATEAWSRPALLQSASGGVWVG
mmetsp:Transcript_67541/g.186462  ORF Transcript_67541/g.186462 Transcript_67541/m.186462 type:complete len:270 (-) Transcript_67541:285-1094(-)